MAFNAYKKTPPRGTGTASRQATTKEEASQKDISTVAHSSSAAQSPTNSIDIKTVASVGAIWRSPRSKDSCIQASFKQIGDGPVYLDLRRFELNRGGRMQPTQKGITVSLARVNHLAELVGKAARQGQKLGMTQVSS